MRCQWRLIGACCLWGCLMSVCLMSAFGGPGQAQGPLRVSPVNPRYFTDGSGRAVYLTGSHTWPNFQNSHSLAQTRPFDYDGYLRFLQAHHHNFIRLWRWELPAWEEEGIGPDRFNVSSPLPWARTGPGLAHDGKPKFDLNRFDPGYFQRLRQRVVAARRAGVYVSIMLFEGWAMQFIKGAWQEHPFHPDNHVGTLTGPPADAKGVEIYEMTYPAVTALQERYVRQVIDTVGDQDNVLYEVSNENHPASTAWQYHFIRFIKNYEATRPKQHPVGMSFQYGGGVNDTLFRSPADWVAPGMYWDSDGLKPASLVHQDDLRGDPPPTDGRKVVVLDTDHLWGVGGDAGWVWKSFLRGYNVLCMDTLPQLNGIPAGTKSDLESIRRAMGDTHALSLHMDLTHMTPQDGLASTGYCLACPACEYVVYQPADASFTVTLPRGRYAAAWFSPVTRRSEAGGTTLGGGATVFHPPFGGGAVLHLKRQQRK